METDPEQIQMLELVYEDIKTVCTTELHMNKKLSRDIKDIEKGPSDF